MLVDAMHTGKYKASEWKCKIGEITALVNRIAEEARRKGPRRPRRQLVWPRHLRPRGHHLWLWHRANCARDNRVCQQHVVGMLDDLYDCQVLLRWGLSLVWEMRAPNGDDDERELVLQMRRVDRDRTLVLEVCTFGRLEGESWMDYLKSDSPSSPRTATVRPRTEPQNRFIIHFLDEGHG